MPLPSLGGAWKQHLNWLVMISFQAQKAEVNLKVPSPPPPLPQELWALPSAGLRLWQLPQPSPTACQEVRSKIQLQQQ